MALSLVRFAQVGCCLDANAPLQISEWSWELKGCLQRDRRSGLCALGVGTSELSSHAFRSPAVSFPVHDRSGMHLICAEMFLDFVYYELMLNIALCKGAVFKARLAFVTSRDKKPKLLVPRKCLYNRVWNPGKTTILTVISVCLMLQLLLPQDASIQNCPFHCKLKTKYLYRHLTVSQKLKL